MAKVRIENVCKRFGDVTAVRDFTLDIREGEFVILVGPSGCGKTTLLRIVAGLESPSSGEILIDGKPITHVPPKKRDIAMVFQNYALYPHKKVYDNLAFCLQLRKTSRAQIKTKVQKTAELLGIDQLLQRYPNELSGGQKQRVALGRAIIRNPKVFLFDEPLSNLDAKLRVSMRTELMDLHQRLQTTSIYVTHDQLEAMTMGTRLVIMRDGLIQQVGTPQEIYRQPVNLFVAGFIGSPAMNFIAGTIREAGSGYFFEAGEIRLKLAGDKAAGLQKHVHQEVILGLRPEHLRKADDRHRPANGAIFAGQVKLVEPLGSEQLVHLEVNGQRLVARLDPLIAMQVGQTYEFSVLMNLTHLFDAQNGRTIL